MIITKEFKFPAEHYIPNHPTCGQTHKHDYVLEVRIKGEVNPETGMVMDFGDVKKIVNHVVLSQLENKHLNDIEMNGNKIFKIPSAENIVKWIYNQLEPKLKGIYEVRLWETQGNSAIYSP